MKYGLLSVLCLGLGVTPSSAQEIEFSSTWVGVESGETEPESCVSTPARPTLSEVYFDGACRNQAWFQANVVSTGFELDWVQGPQWKEEGYIVVMESKGTTSVARLLKADTTRRVHRRHAGYPMLAEQVMEHYETAEGYPAYSMTKGQSGFGGWSTTDWQDVTVMSTTSYETCGPDGCMYAIASGVSAETLCLAKAKVVANAFRTDCFEASAYVSGGTGVVAGLAVGLGVGSLTGPGGLVAGVKAGAGSAVFVGSILMGTCKFVGDTVQDDAELECLLAANGEGTSSGSVEEGDPDPGEDEGTADGDPEVEDDCSPETTSVTRRWEETDQDGNQVICTQEGTMDCWVDLGNECSCTTTWGQEECVTYEDGGSGPAETL